MSYTVPCCVRQSGNYCKVDRCFLSMFKRLGFLVEVVRGLLFGRLVEKA